MPMRATHMSHRRPCSTRWSMRSRRRWRRCGDRHAGSRPARDGAARLHRRQDRDHRRGAARPGGRDHPRRNPLPLKELESCNKPPDRAVQRVPPATCHLAAGRRHRRTLVGRPFPRFAGGATHRRLEPCLCRQGRPEAAPRQSVQEECSDMQLAFGAGALWGNRTDVTGSASAPTSSASCRTCRSTGTGPPRNCGASTSSRSTSRAARARSPARPSSPASSGRSSATCSSARPRRPAS